MLIFTIDKFIYSDVYGAGIGSENLMYYVINEKYIDNARTSFYKHKYHIHIIV